MLQSSPWPRITGIALALSVLAACDSPVTAPESSAFPKPNFAIGAVASELTPELHQDLAALRAYASPLHDLDRAMDAGFDAKVTECRDNPPIGGMGYHYANVGRIDGAPPTVLEPEILVFSPRSNGKLGLGAVEYIVPYAAWTGDPPTLLGQTFHRNDGDGVWMLHVWLWRNNPAGLFEDWNPTVSCG